MTSIRWGADSGGESALQREQSETDVRQRRANAVVEIEANPPAFFEVGVLQSWFRVAEVFADSDRFG